MSVGSLMQEADSAVVWRGPRKTALIKRFVKDTFWGRLDYLIFDILLRLLRDSLGWLVEFIAKFLQFQPEVQQKFFNLIGNLKNFC